jgi:hypothetical protein
MPGTTHEFIGQQPRSRDATGSFAGQIGLVITRLDEDVGTGPIELLYVRLREKAITEYVEVEWHHGLGRPSE